MKISLGWVPFDENGNVISSNRAGARSKIYKSKKLAEAALRYNNNGDYLKDKIVIAHECFIEVNDEF